MTDKFDIDSLVTEAFKLGGSDIHLLPASPVYYRNNTGDIAILSRQYINANEIKAYFLSIATDEQLNKNGDIDLAVSIANIRCRINFFYEQRGLAAVIRLLANKPPKMNEIGLPLSVKNLINKNNGLILFTAPTGNGKSTSIAAMLETINQTKHKRIITIEDPVEYLYTNKASIISQREINRNVVDFANGLHSALREDPDIIMIGEMRDQETILAAIAAAESGHLVFSTLHSADVIQAIDRITQYFSAKQQEIVQSQLSNAFEAIVAQKLIPRKDGQGRIAAFEVLLQTEATKNIIRTGNTYTLRSYMTSKDGMQTMDYSIKELKNKGIIF